MKNGLIVLCFIAPAQAIAGTSYNHLYDDPQAQRIFIEKKIQDFFPEPGLAQSMITIANCESTGLIHWIPDGTLRPNGSGSSARGTFQVLLRYHAQQIQDMGLDMQNIDDYMTFVRQLYDERGFRPWDPSRHCWGQQIVQN